MKRYLVAIQIGVFLAVTVSVVAYALFVLVGVRVVNRPYDLTAVFTNGGGVFDGSEVTYRGVRVGTVTNVKLNPDRVVATLAINPDERVPADSTATVMRLSAVGEQYVDLSSSRSSGPYLAAGDTIRTDHTTGPPNFAHVLTSASSLMNSIDPKDLSTLSTELAAGYGGADIDMRTILDQTTQLLRELDASSGTLDRLVDHSAVILRTMNAHRRDLHDFSTAAPDVAQTLADLSPDIERLVKNGRRTAEVGNGVLKDLDPAFPSTAGSIARLLNLQQDNTGWWPALLAGISDVENELPLVERRGKLQAYGLFDYTQPVCSFTDTMTSPLSGIQTPVRAHLCKNPPAGTLQRGPQNAPR